MIKISEMKRLADNAISCAFQAGDLLSSNERQLLAWTSSKKELHEAIDKQQVEIDKLRTDRDMALEMLAHWCVAVDSDGSSWDYWDDHYKDAMYRDGPLRELLDKAISEAREHQGKIRNI